MIGQIKGEVYAPAPGMQAIATLTSGLWLGGLALMFAGDPIFSAMGIQQPPSFYTTLKENKLVVGGILFIINNIGDYYSFTRYSLIVVIL